MGKYISPPILDELKKVDLVTYFRTIMPYELVKASANEYTTKTHDSLRMSNSKAGINEEKYSVHTLRHTCATLL